MQFSPFFSGSLILIVAAPFLIECYPVSFTRLHFLPKVYVSRVCRSRKPALTHERTDLD